MDGETGPAHEKNAKTAVTHMTRRDAMLQLLRLGGVAAGAAGAGVWLSDHSSRPIPALGRQARRDHRIGCRCPAAADYGCSRRRAARAGAAGA